MRGRAAEQMLAAIGGRFDIINGNGADDDKGHGKLQVLDWGRQNEPGNYAGRRRYPARRRAEAMPEDFMSNGEGPIASSI